MASCGRQAKCKARAAAPKQAMGVNALFTVVCDDGGWWRACCVLTGGMRLRPASAKLAAPGKDVTAGFAWLRPAPSPPGATTLALRRVGRLAVKEARSWQM